MFVVIITIILCVYIIKLLCKSHFSNLQHIPMPPSWPIIGHTINFLREDNITLLEEWGKKFKGVFRIQSLLGDYNNIVFVTEPEYIKEILSNPSNYIRNDFFEKYFPILGNGLLTASGTSHQLQRKLLGKAFSLSHVKNYYPVFHRELDILISKWEKKVSNSHDGNVLTIQEDFQRLTFDVIGEVGFCSKFYAQLSQSHPFISAYKEMTEGSVLDFKNRLLMTIFPFMWYLPFGPASTWKKAMSAAKRITNEILENRRQKYASGTATEEEKRDLLSMMLNAKDEKTGDCFSDQLIKDNMMVFLVAGHETTSTALPGMLLFLAQYPHYQERIRNEIKENLIDNSFESINKLEFTSAFLKECLRLYPAIPYEGRLTKNDCSFGGYDIPKGTGIFCLQLTINKHDSFSNSEQFLPERYLRNSDLSCGQTITFGYGPYNCIGKHLAIQEMKVTLVRLLQNFRFEIAEKVTYFRCAKLSLKTSPDIKVRVINIAQHN